MSKIAVTYDECIQFVLDHRRDKVFKGFTPENIFETIRQAAYKGAFCYVIDEDSGKLVGIVAGEPHEDIKQLHITHILCIKRGVMREMLKQFEKHFSGWTITATRYGEKVIYTNTKNLCKKICCLK